MLRFPANSPVDDWGVPAPCAAQLRQHPGGRTNKFCRGRRASPPANLDSKRARGWNVAAEGAHRPNWRVGPTAMSSSSPSERDCAGSGPAPDEFKLFEQSCKSKWLLQKKRNWGGVLLRDALRRIPTCG